LEIGKVEGKVDPLTSKQAIAKTRNNKEGTSLRAAHTSKYISIGSRSSRHETIRH